MRHYFLKLCKYMGLIAFSIIHMKPQIHTSIDNAEYKFSQVQYSSVMNYLCTVYSQIFF